MAFFVLVAVHVGHARDRHTADRLLGAEGTRTHLAGRVLALYQQDLRWPCVCRFAHYHGVHGEGRPGPPVAGSTAAGQQQLARRQQQHCIASSLVRVTSRHGSCCDLSAQSTEAREALQVVHGQHEQCQDDPAR